MSVFLCPVLPQAVYEFTLTGHTFFAMTKDPAFLFYYQDFLVGTSFMTFDERGAYITILCYLADKGTISRANIDKIIPKPIWEAICCKFIEEDGVFYNKRLRDEVDKRQHYTASRRKNLHMKDHMDSHKENHMENENENENINENKKQTTILLKYFGTKYKERFEETYMANFKKDMQLFKEFLRVMSGEEVKAKIDLFFKSNDEFIKKAGFTVGVFRSQINKFIKGDKHGNDIPEYLREFIEK